MLSPVGPGACPSPGRPPRPDEHGPPRRVGPRAARDDDRRGDRPGLRARQRSPGVREQDRRRPGGDVPLPAPAVGVHRRLRGVGWAPAHPRRDPREAACPGHLPRADHPAYRPRPPPAGRRGRGGRTLGPAFGRGGVLGARLADSGLGHEARRVAVPAGGAGRARTGGIPTGARTSRRRAAGGGLAQHPREPPRRDPYADPGRLALRPEGGRAGLHGLERASRSRPRGAVGGQGRAAAPCLRVPQPRGDAPRRPRPGPLGTTLRDPAREGRLLPARDDAAGGGARQHETGPSVLGASAGGPGDPFRHVLVDPLVQPRDGLRSPRARAPVARSAGPLRPRPLRPAPGGGIGPEAGASGSDRGGLERLAGAAARAGLGRRGGARRGPDRRGQRRPAAPAHGWPARHVEGARRCPRVVAAVHGPDRRGDTRGLPHRVVAGPRSRLGRGRGGLVLEARPRSAGEGRAASHESVPALPRLRRRAAAARRLPGALNPRRRAVSPDGSGATQRPSRGCDGTSRRPC